MLQPVAIHSSRPVAGRLAAVLRAHDSVVSLRNLLEAGFSRRQVAALRHDGALLRPRIGWYAAPDLPDDAVAAVRVGGVLGCVSAARAWQLVVPTVGDGLVHVSLADHATRLRSSDDMTRRALAGTDPGARWHWEQRVAAEGGHRVGVLDAIVQMAACIPDKWLLAAIDSGLQPHGEFGEPLLDAHGLDRLRGLLPERLSYLVDLATPDSQSPGESMAKLGLAIARMPYRLQVPIAGRYFGDILIDEWLLMEVDGSEFHSGHEPFVRDRERDALTSWWGYRPLRFTQQQVDAEWPWVLEVVQRVLAAGPPTRR